MAQMCNENFLETNKLFFKFKILPEYTDIMKWVFYWQNIELWVDLFL